jgi:hypothetical protein
MKMQGIIRKYLLLAGILTIACIAYGQKAYYTPADSTFISHLLNEARRQPSTANIPLFFANSFLGKPYVAHTLEVFDDERLIVNIREFDCTTLVENVTALTLCIYQRRYAFADYLDALRRLRYRDGLLDKYPSRLHYFSDWIENKQEMGLITEIQSPVPPFLSVQRLNINYMSKHASSYKALQAHPEYIIEIKQQEKMLTGKTYRYIPKKQIANASLLKKAVRSGDIIAITCNKPGLDIAHLGFAVWRKGQLHLLNASMIHHKVVDEPMTLYQYLRKHPSHTGIRIVRINR